MTTEEFYAQALLAALPLAIEKSLHDKKSEAISFANEYWSFHKLGDVTAFKKGPNQDRAFRHSF